MSLNVEVLERTFELLKPQAEELANHFYERLFSHYPAVQPMFAKASMPDQKKKLVASLVLVIQNLRHQDALIPALKQLGARHVAYGTKPEHYPAVAETLLSVMAEMAGPAWTPEVQQAWSDALTTVATIMIEGAKEHASQHKSTHGGTKMEKGKKEPKSQIQAKELAARVEAINRVQAVIEFQMDGTIITANDNFLKCLGYSLEEIKGQHHRMFAEPTYANSPEYAAFWAKLNRGEHDSGIYRRLGKGGKEIWIQASYNPLLDDKGKPYKVIKFANDVTEEKRKALVKSALDNSNSNVLMCDRNLIVTYINKAAQDKLKGLEQEIRKALPNFSADKVVGTCIDSFHKVPDVQRRILDNPRNLPHRADIQLGPLTLELSVAAIVSDTGEYLGNSLEWADVTAKRRAETEMARLKASLDNARSNVLVCDRSYTLVYANNQSVTTLRRLEAEIRKVMPQFSVDKVVGSSIDQYHKNPAHQRQLLDNPQNLPYRTEIKIGPLILDLAVAAIMNERGEYVGNVVEWADITAQKKAQGEVDKLIRAATAGQLTERINADEFEGFFKDLSVGVNTMLDAVVTPLHEAQMVLTALAANDLTRTMTGHYEGEFEQMKASLNSATQTLGSALSTVREAAESVTSGAEEITKGNEDLSSRTSQQASSLEETSASMEEMTSTVKQNADNAKQANQLAVAARDIADRGGAVTKKAVDAMGEINKSSKKIADIITVIDEIAFQTNLLALNAAVEAARAGEHGRGFAVVAAEVRNLAQRSATAAKEIKGLINESIQRVTDGSELVNQSGKTLEEIVGSVKRVTDIIAEISAASQEQAQGIDQVNKAIMQMDETTQQNAALVEETTSASQSMKEQAKELMRQVEVFKVPASDGHRSQTTPRVVVTSTQPSFKPSGTSSSSKSGLKKPTFGAKPAEEKPRAGVTSGNGHDRRQKDDDFEEF